ncbi:helix-turn-helix domain-containing protein [Niabella ginsengisoli]|uniref:Helix-turn-helix domain-containing protein n=1 Tax=Niabella ginsengisoli TaxID=522298 RepID=A0ABS9SMW5_9BACT|nr:helix-turn-helix domain-containing protein [Niabella ginsengisoli]MCH5599494.1 helix-turn-helix domain-containing protein [Niabella ginsengisoli]
MDLQEFGKRVQQVREEVLRIKQHELATELNTHQGIISRLERGIGGSLDLVFEFLSLLESRGYTSHVLFAKQFSILSVTGREKINKVNVPSEAVNEKFKLLKQTLQQGYEQMVAIDSLFEFEKTPAKKGSKK